MVKACKGWKSARGLLDQSRRYVDRTTRRHPRKGGLCDLEDAGQAEWQFLPARGSPNVSRELQQAVEADDRCRGHRGHDQPDVQELLRGNGWWRHTARCAIAPERTGGRQRHGIPPPACPAEVHRNRTNLKAAAAGGADLRLPRRGLCRHPLFLAVAGYSIGTASTAPIICPAASADCGRRRSDGRAHRAWRRGCRSWTQNRENNPMQSRMRPGSRHLCCAAAGAREKWSVATAPN